MFRSPAPLFLTAMDGRHAENAGAFFGSPWMAGMQQIRLRRHSS
jgi:hypothetical protein